MIEPLCVVRILDLGPMSPGNTGKPEACASSGNNTGTRWSPLPARGWCRTSSDGMWLVMYGRLSTAHRAGRCPLLVAIGCIYPGSMTHRMGR